jgi:hypothetical protein
MPGWQAYVAGVVWALSSPFLRPAPTGSADTRISFRSGSTRYL